MKRLVVLIAAGLIAIGMIGSSVSAQDPPLDLGASDVFLLACDRAIHLALAENIETRWCRRAEADVIDGNRAIVTVKIATTEYGKFIVTFEFQKSLWSTQTVAVTPAG